MPDPPIRVVLVVGVAGSGKTTVGRTLAPRLEASTGDPWMFADADDFHSAEALQKMASSEALTDADRAPWLARLAGLVRDHVAGGDCLVLACSALRVAYRETLTGSDPRVAVVWLDVPRDVLAARLEARLAAHSGNPIGPSLLPSQLATFEEPAEALRLDATHPVEALADTAAAWVNASVRGTGYEVPDT